MGYGDRRSKCKNPKVLILFLRWNYAIIGIVKPKDMKTLKVGQQVTIKGGYKGIFVGYTNQGLEVRALEGINKSCQHNGIHTYQREFISPFVKFDRERKITKRTNKNNNRLTTANELVNYYKSI